MVTVVVTVVATVMVMRMGMALVLVMAMVGAGALAMAMALVMVLVVNMGGMIWSAYVHYCTHQCHTHKRCLIRTNMPTRPHTAHT